MAFDLKNRWALVTGASVGIGKCLAEQLAEAGANLVLVARREELLNDLAAELEEHRQIQTRVIALDLTAPDAVSELMAQIQDLPVSVLINNAGFAETGPFESTEEQRLLNMLQLNVVFLTQMTRALLPRLLKEPQGARILNVGSLAGYMGVPQMAGYSATKAFVNHFSEALAWELRHSGVRVTSLEPGSTQTEFFEVAGMQGSFMSKINLMPASQVAKAGVRAMIAGRRRLVAGVVNKLGVFALRLSPRWLVGWVVGHLFADLNKAPK